jgi:pyrimidine operon attenuation protein/uracil phosphoribosyltransferase
MPSQLEGNQSMLDLREKQRLMSASEIERTLVRLAHQILEKSGGAAPGLVGIERRGVPLAERLASLLETLTHSPVDRGRLNIELYRDDLSTHRPRAGSQEKHATVKPAPLGFDVTGRDILLVDDVLYTGRTVRAALDALIDHGRPRRVQLLALIDRGHRELPIEASFVGRIVATTEQDTVEVRLTETDDMEEVVLVERAN